MTEKESCVREWISEIEKRNEDISIPSYFLNSKILINETPIDDIVPKSGYDVIIFIVENFWRSEQCKRWIQHYNDKYPYYVFFENEVEENTPQMNMILCQSKRKSKSIRKKIEEENENGLSEST